MVQKRRKINRPSFNLCTHRLRKRGLIRISDNRFELTQKGIDYWNYKRIFVKPSGNTKIICIFDIPEHQKKAREWLRTQLKLWNFKMIQKSVWIGQGPFPKEFKDRLKFMSISRGVKTFKISKQSE